MRIKKYSSRNEDSLLKSMGPHIIANTCRPIGESILNEVEVGTPEIKGKMELYGEISIWESDF